MEVEGINFDLVLVAMTKKTQAAGFLEWQYESEERIWGKFYNLTLIIKLSLKELIVATGKGMSLQKHFHRDEIWFISKLMYCKFL